MTAIKLVTNERDATPLSPLKTPSCEPSLIAAARAGHEAKRVLIADHHKNPLGNGQLPTRIQIEDARRRVRGAIEVLDRSLEPAGEEFAESLLAMLSAAFPPSRGSEQDLRLKAAVYIDELKDIPADLLAEGSRRTLRKCRFFPSIAEILGAGEIDGVEILRSERIEVRDEFAQWLARSSASDETGDGVDPGEAS